MQHTQLSESHVFYTAAWGLSHCWWLFTDKCRERYTVWEIERLCFKIESSPPTGLVRRCEKRGCSKWRNLSGTHAPTLMHTHLRFKTMKSCKEVTVEGNTEMYFVFRAECSCPKRANGQRVTLKDCDRLGNRVIKSTQNSVLSTFTWAVKIC